jgi:hypothetical protein
MGQCYPKLPKLRDRNPNRGGGDGGEGEAQTSSPSERRVPPQRCGDVPSTPRATAIAQLPAAASSPSIGTQTPPNQISATGASPRPAAAGRIEFSAHLETPSTLEPTDSSILRMVYAPSGSTQREHTTRSNPSTRHRKQQGDNQADSIGLGPSPAHSSPSKSPARRRQQQQGDRQADSTGLGPSLAHSSPSKSPTRRRQQ